MLIDGVAAAGDRRRRTRPSPTAPSTSSRAELAPADQRHRPARRRHDPHRRLRRLVRRRARRAVASPRSRANPHGIDLGPLAAAAARRAAAPRAGTIELAPAPVIADLARLAASLDRPLATATLVLVGRRHLRSNNSWMHNVNVLVKGKERCTLQVHPDDASRLGLVDGGSGRGARRGSARSSPRSRSPTPSAPAS